MRRISLFYFIILIFLWNFLLLGCGIDKNYSFSLISVEKEIELGKLYTPSSIDEFEGLYPEKEIQEYVSYIGNKLAKEAERKVPYKFWVVNSNVVNAFALPGGPVIITRGLLLQLDKESQLAGVLAHEIGHINARHHVRFLEKTLALNLILQVGSLFLPQNLTGEILFRLGEISAGLLSLKFSRDQEREADKYGFLFTLKAGYSPQGMIEVFEKFKALERERPPEWLSTHPLPETRIKEARDYIKTFKLTGSLISDTSNFQRIKTHLLSTKESYDYVEKGKQAYKRKELTQAENYFKKALELYPQNTVALIYLTYINLEKNRFSEALEMASQAVKIDPQFFRAQLLVGITYFKVRNFEKALFHLNEAQKLIPFNGISYYYKGRIYEEENKLNEAAKNYKKALEIGPKNASWYKDCYARYQKIS